MTEGIPAVDRGVLCNVLIFLKNDLHLFITPRYRSSAFYYQCKRVYAGYFLLLFTLWEKQHQESCSGVIADMQHTLNIFIGKLDPFNLPTWHITSRF